MRILILIIVTFIVSCTPTKQILDTSNNFDDAKKITQETNLISSEKLVLENQNEKDTFSANLSKSELVSVPENLEPEIVSDPVILFEEPSSIIEVVEVDEIIRDDVGNRGIKILHFSSWEASFLPSIIKNKKLGGAAYITATINKIKEKDDVILCNTGNFFRGDINDRRPVVKVLNLMGLDICNISNLELNYGPGNLKDKLEDANFKILSANIYEKDKLLFSTSKIIEKNGYRIGFIGITSREAAVQSIPKAIENLIFREPINELKKVIEEIKSQTDMIVVLSNLRHKQDVEIAKMYPKIDLIVGRYVANKFDLSEQVKNTLIVRTNQKQGTQLGEVTILPGNFIKAKDAKVYAVGQDAPIFNQADIATQNIITDWQNSEKVRQEVLCETSSFLQGDYLKVRQQETNLGNLFADIILETQKDAQVSLLNSGAIRASIPKGSITYGMVLDALPYKNKIVRLEILGSTLKEVLENSVAHYESIPGAFLQVGGISFSFSKKAAPFSRIKEITVQGESLVLEKKYKVLTLDYIASGGDDYIMLKEKKNFYTSKESLATVIANYLRKEKKIHPRVEERIQILD